MGLSDEQQIAAILHDCYEDGELEADPPFQIGSIIASLFGAKVYRLVHLLTRCETMSYDKYIDMISHVHEVIPVKLADLADNLDPSRGPIPDSLRERYEKAQRYLLEKGHER